MSVTSASLTPPHHRRTRTRSAPVTPVRSAPGAQLGRLCRRVRHLPLGVHPVRQHPRPRHHPAGVQPARRRRRGRGRPPLHLVGTAPQQPGPAGGVPPCRVGEPHRRLRQPAPQGALLCGTRLPRVLEHLVRVEGPPRPQQLLRLVHRRPRRPDHPLRRPRHPRRAVRQGPAQAVPGAGVARLALGVPVPSPVRPRHRAGLRAPVIPGFHDSILPATPEQGRATAHAPRARVRRASGTGRSVSSVPPWPLGSSE
ncbi:hypothetical protein DC60_11640 [Streptomyces wadayamensis]|uniref:Uncharacterized protein n=1 Tax=Streptomyces wadayamensis TaxID=141454 RepID=A0ABR4SE27_9ACTN|nr:hypothetical protein DC60_11640 [Streptomyces wadayamensis]